MCIILSRFQNSSYSILFLLLRYQSINQSINQSFTYFLISTFFLSISVFVSIIFVEANSLASKPATTNLSLSMEMPEHLISLLSGVL
jgi:hypothetical protein